MINALELTKGKWTWKSAKKTFCPECGHHAWKNETRYIAYLDRIIQKYRCPACKNVFDDRDI